MSGNIIECWRGMMFNRKKIKCLEVELNHWRKLSSERLDKVKELEGKNKELNYKLSKIGNILSMKNPIGEDCGKTISTSWEGKEYYKKKTK